MSVGQYVLEYFETGIRLARWTTVAPDSSCCTVETFATKDEMDARIVELGFEVPGVERELTQGRFDEMIAQVTGE